MNLLLLIAECLLYINYRFRHYKIGGLGIFASDLGSTKTSP